MCLDQYFLKQKILSQCYVITCNSLLLSSLPWALYQLEGRKTFIPMKYFISGTCCQRWCSLHSLRFSETTVDEATVARFNLVYLILPWAGGSAVFYVHTLFPCSWHFSGPNKKFFHYFSIFYIFLGERLWSAFCFPSIWSWLRSGKHLCSCILEQVLPLCLVFPWFWSARLFTRAHFTRVPLMSQ